MKISLNSNLFCLLFVFTSLINLSAQTIPVSADGFIKRLNINNKLPEKILSGRSILIYSLDIDSKELEKIQASFASTGIDAVIAIESEKIFGGQDVRRNLFLAIQKREISNLVFIREVEGAFQCFITKYNNKPDFVSLRQSAWAIKTATLSDLLIQINREALAAFKKQNFLINDQPETELPLTIITGSRIEGFTPDLRGDIVAVRLSANEEDVKLKEVCGNYPYKMEFVPDSLSDIQLRQMGFWYTLNCLHARESVAKEWLGYPANNPNKGVITPNLTGFAVYKFYLKKLEYDNFFLGKNWDADVSWEVSLLNFITNLRTELPPK